MKSLPCEVGIVLDINDGNSMKNQPVFQWVFPLDGNRRGFFFHCSKNAARQRHQQQHWLGNGEGPTARERELWADGYFDKGSVKPRHF